MKKCKHGLRPTSCIECMENRLIALENKFADIRALYISDSKTIKCYQQATTEFLLHRDVPDAAKKILIKLLKSTSKEARHESMSAL